MKARKIIGAIGVAAATLATIAGPQATATTQANQTTIQQDVKATQRERRVISKKVVHNVGGSGLDLVTDYPKGSGLSPKEYGMRYGDGKSRKGKVNKLHLKHGYKVKRRSA